MLSSQGDVLDNTVFGENNQGLTLLIAVHAAAFGRGRRTENASFGNERRAILAAPYTSKFPTTSPNSKL